MSAHRLKHLNGEQPSLTKTSPIKNPLARLAELGVVDIETPMVGSLSGDLHALFDPVCHATLPIYFGPLLGRLYLEGL